jgi:hypothetical protein
MKKLIMMVIVLLFGVLFAQQSEWVNTQIEDIASESDYDYAWSSIFGWGEGSIADQPFEWVCYTNSDGWLQFRFSQSIDPETEYNLESFFSVVNFQDYSWIGLDNDWATEDNISVDKEHNVINAPMIISVYQEMLGPYGFNFSPYAYFPLAKKD